MGGGLFGGGRGENKRKKNFLNFVILLLENQTRQKVADVSSTRLFGLFCSQRVPSLLSSTAGRGKGGKNQMKKK